MNVLVIVHLEPDFSTREEPLDELVEKVIAYAESFDKVINITSAGSLTGTAPYPELMNFRNEEWIWGFDAEAYLQEESGVWKEGVDYIPTTGHPYSEICDWMHQLSKSDEYTLVGGARWECLQDVYEIFQHLNLKTGINNSLTYG